MMRALWVAVAGVLLSVSAAGAQVGYTPGKSPYHDIYKGHAFTVTYGHLGGGGGDFGIAPHSGDSYGVRYDIRAGSAVQLGLGFSHAKLERLIVSPAVLLANRVSGPVNQTVNFAEATLQLNLTGGKSWHHLAPFVEAAAGVAFAGSTPADTSGFKFGKKIYLAPAAGTRIFITSRLHLRAEARATFWKLKYPSSFMVEPVEEPGIPPDNSNAVIPPGGPGSEWTATSWLMVGLGYSFSL